MPSPFFMHWYFNHPHHHYHYAHLSHHFVNHYYGHRSYGSSIVGSVHTWKKANRDVITDDWVNIDKRERIRTLKEFGQMEKARADYNKVNPKQPVSKVDYIKNNKGRYPALEKNTDIKVKTKPTATKPRETVVPNKPVTRNKPNVDTKTKTKTKDKRKTNKSIEVKKARDYHRETWKTPKTKTRTKTYRPKVRTKPPVKKQKPRTKIRKPN